jgi:hypothetical protein
MRSSLLAALWIGLAAGTWSRFAPAEDARAGAVPELQVTSTTYLRLYQRALLPGAAGAPVVTQSIDPVYEYLSLRAAHLEGPWGGDLVVEFSGWGNGLINRVPGENRFDGDVTVLNAQQRIGPSYVKIGRQVIARGASRFTRIDGVLAGALAGPFGVDAYGGLTVLPRFSQRIGYFQLGSATDSLVRSPDALPDPARGGYWAVGGRAHYDDPTLGQIGASVHEQHEAYELAHRNAALDLLALPRGPVTVSALAIMDVDSTQFSDVRAAADASFSRRVDLNLEYRRTDPALFLSRQSVLSVFSTTIYDEFGGELRYRPALGLTIAGSAFLEYFHGGQRGGRVFLRANFTPGTTKQLQLQAVMGRVVESDNGYVTGRASARLRITAPAAVVAEHYSYFYDQPIRGVGTSTVDSANLEWELTPELRALVGGSTIRSPYASLDAQMLLRIVYGTDLLAGGGR